jgi:hypothetical protein
MTVFAGIAIAGLAVLVGVVAQDWMWGALAAVALTVVSLDAFLPTKYAADEQGLSIHGTLKSKRVLWKDVRSVASERDGAYLKTALRGVTVLLDCPERGAWLRDRAHCAQAVQQVQAAPGAPVEPGAPAASATPAAPTREARA